MNPLTLCATWPRATLATGLAAGIALPDLARAMAGHLPLLVGLVMFLGALRLSPAELRGLQKGLARALGRILALQLLAPLALALVALLCGLAHSPVLAALILMAAAPPIVGSANIAALLGLDPGRAMQLMLAGTVALPLTVLPVFWLLPAFGSPDQVLRAALRLLTIIALAGGGALLVRMTLLRRSDASTLKAIDGASILGLAIFVIALMPAVAGAAQHNTPGFLGWLLLAVVANFGTQIALRQATGPTPDPLALVAGNRNISLFFAALPATTTDPLLVFLGCYQLPMLLSPALLGWLYKPHPNSPTP